MIGIKRREGEEYDAAAGTGDFSKMIGCAGFANALCIFNDNTQDANGFPSASGKWDGKKGSGNGKFRPHAFEPQPSALGIPTGISSGFQSLADPVGSESAKDVIDLSVRRIVSYLCLRPELSRVFFSRDEEEDRLGKGTFDVHVDVLKYITEQLRAIPQRVAEMQARWVLRSDLMEALEDGKYRSGRLGDWARQQLGLASTNSDAPMPDASAGVRGRFRLHGVSPNGNCWGFGPLASIGLLEHEWTSGASNPAAIDNFRVNQLLRPRMHKYLLSDDGADIRKDYGLNASDGTPDRSKIDLVLNDGDWDAQWYLSALAAVLGADLASFHRPGADQSITGYFADKRQLTKVPGTAYTTPSGKARQRMTHPTITEAEFARRIDAPEQTAMIPLQWNGSNHFSGMVLLDKSPFSHLPPLWLRQVSMHVVACVAHSINLCASPENCNACRYHRPFPLLLLRAVLLVVLVDQRCVCVNAQRTLPAFSHAYAAVHRRNLSVLLAVLAALLVPVAS